MKSKTYEIWKKFNKHRHRAKWRGIEFLLTFEEWFDIWRRSGKLDQMGRGRGKYCMARFGDIGPYAKGNVRIITCEENSGEHKHSPETKAKMSRDRTGPGGSFYGKKHSESSKLLIGAKSLGRKDSPQRTENRRKAMQKLETARRAARIPKSSAKLTFEQAEEIKKNFVSGSPLYGAPALAKRYLVCVATIRNVIRGDTYQ